MRMASTREPSRHSPSVAMSGHRWWESHFQSVGTLNWLRNLFVLQSLFLQIVFLMVQGDADSALDRLWAKKKAELGQWCYVLCPVKCFKIRVGTHPIYYSGFGVLVVALPTFKKQGFAKLRQIVTWFSCDCLSEACLIRGLKMVRVRLFAVQS